MARIIFREDINLQNSINTLNTNKVDITTFNAKIADINTQLTNLSNTVDTKFQEAKDYADSLVNSLKANEIKALQDAINLLNADDQTEGSVDYKIKSAITALVNGAPETADTLKELLDLINNDAATLNDLIASLNQKIADLKGNVSADFDTLEKIETKIKETQQQIVDAQTATNAAIQNVAGSIPVYQYEAELSIASGNKITLANAPIAGQLFKGRVEVVSEVKDQDGNVIDMIVEGIYTASKDPNDNTGKVFIIESSEDLSGKLANVDYFTEARNLQS